MKKNIPCLMLTLFLLILLTPAAYAGDKPGNEGLTLDNTVAMALNKSNKLKQIDYDIERSEEVRKSAAEKVYFIPAGPGSDPAAVAAFTGLVAMDTGLQMTKKNKVLEADRITLNVFNKYAAAMTADTSLGLAGLQRDKAQRDWQIALLSYDLGVISRTQLKLAEVGHKAAGTGYELAQKEADKAYQDLNNLIGLKPQERPVLTEDIKYKPLEVDNLDNTITRIMDDNPAIWLAEQNARLENLKLELYNWTDPLREPYQARKIDVEKAELSATDAKKQMREGLYSLYQGIMLLEDNYKMAEQGLRAAEEEFALKELQYEVGMLSGQDYLAAQLALAKSENDFNKIVYQHESLKQSFYKPWANM